MRWEKKANDGEYGEFGSVLREKDAMAAGNALAALAVCMTLHLAVSLPPH